MWRHREQLATCQAMGEAWNRSFPHSLRRNQSCWHPDFKLPASRTVRERISVVQAPKHVVLCYNSPKTLLRLLHFLPPWPPSNAYCIMRSCSFSITDDLKLLKHLSSEALLSLVLASLGRLLSNLCMPFLPPFLFCMECLIFGSFLISFLHVELSNPKTGISLLA